MNLIAKCLAKERQSRLLRSIRSSAAAVALVIQSVSRRRQATSLSGDCSAIPASGYLLARHKHAADAFIGIHCLQAV